VGVLTLDLLSWMTSVKDDPDVLAAIDSGQINPLPGLQSTLESLIAELNSAGDGLGKLLAKSCEHRTWHI
jgi:hypothetical protein